ncbi:MAG: hypothetical protein ACRDI2_01490 [Chloroflexota bacterium]
MQSKDVLLRGRVDAALHRAVSVARTHTEPDGERVLDGWEEVSPTDSRYPTLFVLQAARLGLTDVEVDVVTREGRAAVDAAESRE